MCVAYFIFIILYFIGLYKTNQNVNVFHKHASDIEQGKCPFQQQNPTFEHVKKGCPCLNNLNIYMNKLPGSTCRKLHFTCWKSDANFLGTLTNTCSNDHFTCSNLSFTCWKTLFICWRSDASILGTLTSSRSNDHFTCSKLGFTCWRCNASFLGTLTSSRSNGHFTCSKLGFACWKPFFTC